ncbi:AAA family ATPase [Sanyastnella coralliicola]|uniref:AAA family ATPase n=1 Tax=Sanyastnella coralliicola TaxID=3069118 RepID=UPI0027BA7BB3|nr:AAA family ATPase [Longitalea sp. SCSIO 12813]
MKASEMEATTAAPQTAMKARIDALASAMCKGLYERDEVMRLALLTAISGESIFLLGPPGVGKSLIARRLKYAFSEGKTFEYLMTRFSTPDEVFGPISIKRLKEDDQYERLTENYMPDASVVFLDEIWKSSSSIQNALLTIINERVYRNGQQELPVNIRAIITASNELPDAGDSFGPLWDRLLVRYDIQGIQSGKNFRAMITDTEEVYEDPVPAELKISEQELNDWNQAIDQVAIPEEVVTSLEMIKQRIEKRNAKNPNEAPILIYDRRWKKTIRLLRTSAFLNGRSKVDLMDLFLTMHCLWNNPGQITPLREIVARTVREHGYSIALPLGQLSSEVEAFEDEVNEETTVKLTEEQEVLTPFDDVWYKLIKPDAQFEGILLKVNDFNRLQTGEFEVTNFYDASGNLVNRLQASKSSKAFEIVIKYNSLDLAYKLHTHKAEKTRKVKRKAHKMLVHHWNDRYQLLHQDVSKALTKVESSKPEHWQEMHEHLFTSGRLVPLVKANMEEVAGELNKLKLRLEKLRFDYEEQQ